MKFSQFIEDSSLSFNHPITQEEWDRITDVELENTETITFKTPSGKEVPFIKVKHGEWIELPNGWDGIDEYLRFECSECRREVFGNFPYCPYCGADMRGETE